MNIVIWIIQGVLAAMFLMAGTQKATQPVEKLKVKFPFVNDISLFTLRFIGISQLLIAAGLILPQLTGIAVILTPLAATGLALNMVLAAVYHIRKNENKAILTNAVIFLLSGAVAYYRFLNF